ncbi:hypothetical protein THAOC_12665 [Thalassiosira oceanica]|uniref:SPRY domain-containing protein n=1 Tax=Thalassiosira oceanica TaxID=159749 RepID=K0SJG8_THAOC|nr:hypothetical protein THAOC_12665 [Thalassiosira oceanica]|eukprot:EJK66423.1 hypothetical protein THAOC_12665 [Thalassiosira oceanica]
MEVPSVFYFPEGGQAAGSQPPGAQASATATATGPPRLASIFGKRNPTLAERSGVYPCSEELGLPRTWAAGGNRMLGCTSLRPAGQGTRRQRESVSTRAGTELPQRGRKNRLDTMRPRDNKRAKLSPSATIDALDNDLLFRFASYLDADGLAQLGRTSARFGIPQAGQQISLANEAARQRFRESATDEEGSRLPKYDNESDVGLLRALEQLRQPLCFDELVGRRFGPQEHPARVTYTGCNYFYSTALSGHVMRGGRSFVEFEIKGERSSYISLGVIRPVSLTDGIDLEADWRGIVDPVFASSSYKPTVAEKLRSQRTARWGESNVHCCAYYSSSGHCLWTDWDTEEDDEEWQGQERLGRSGTIGLLLDLDEGTLSVFRNGRRLGAMKGGLGGEYCWFMTVGIPCTISMSKGRFPN